jgi:hypothetical protein
MAGRILARFRPLDENPDVLWKPGENIFTERHTHRQQAAVDIGFLSADDELNQNGEKIQKI